MKTKILLMFCVLLLTAAPAMAVNIVGFNIVTPNGTPGLSGMFSIDFDSPDRATSGITLSIDNITFDQADLTFDTFFNFTLGVGPAVLTLSTNDGSWKQAGGAYGTSCGGTPTCPFPGRWHY